VRNCFGSAPSPLPARERMKVRVRIQRPARFRIPLLKLGGYAKLSCEGEDEGEGPMAPTAFRLIIGGRVSAARNLRHGSDAAQSCCSHDGLIKLKPRDETAPRRRAYACRLVPHGTSAISSC
jgi:hypothetical protein